MFPEVSPKLEKPLKYAAGRHVPVLAILGEDERARGEVTVRDLQTRKQEAAPRATAADWIARRVRIMSARSARGAQVTAKQLGTVHDVHLCTWHRQVSDLWQNSSATGNGLTPAASSAPTDLGTDATLLGWVHRVRDLGGVLFIDIRDREGVSQIVVRDDETLLAQAKRFRPEYVIGVRGLVENRSADTVNPELATGEVEVLAREFRLLNEAKTPPFQIAEDNPVSEDVRLRYRYLDLRRPRLQANIGLRHRVALAVRQHLDEQGFWEIETPILTKSTPEGARDYLVPSRVHPGEFFALPQSPQIFKQILMIAGMDRYFQITRCFRDEDLRADRQPEFTQVDVEMSFAQPGSDLRPHRAGDPADLPVSSDVTSPRRFAACRTRKRWRSTGRTSPTCAAGSKSRTCRRHFGIPSSACSSRSSPKAA